MDTKMNFKRLYEDMFSNAYCTPPSDIRKGFEIAMDIMKLTDRERFIIIALYANRPMKEYQVCRQMEISRNEIEVIKDTAFSKLRSRKVRDIFVYGLTTATIREYEQAMFARRIQAV